MLVKGILVDAVGELCMFSDEGGLSELLDDAEPGTELVGDISTDPVFSDKLLRGDEDPKLRMF